jgi:hypothetical protein
MKMQAVDSGAIDAIGHDPQTNTLAVQFKSGHTYHFEDVSAEEHEALANADSIGAHFARHIRPKGGKKA